MEESTEGLTAFSDLDNKALKTAITRHAVHVNSAQCRLLQLIGEFDCREAWKRDGMRSCAHWLNLHCGIALGAAREKVRVALALKRLPGILANFETGQLSYSKVRALTRIASISNEDSLLSRAHDCSASELEKDIRLRRHQNNSTIEQAPSPPAHQDESPTTATDSTKPNPQVGPPNTQPSAQAAAQPVDDHYVKRSLDYRWDEEGFLIIRAKLCPDQGALVLKSIEAAAESLRTDEFERDRDSKCGRHCDCNCGDDDNDKSPTTGFQNVPEETFETNPQAWFGQRANRRADALALMAETHLQHIDGISNQADRYQVVVHVEQQVLANAVDPALSNWPDCFLENETGIPVETVRRLSCDSKLVAMLKEGGEPLAVSRRSRSIPSAIRRALSERDQGCRFPGCTTSRYVDGHHIVHWADGGETSLHNLVMLCRHHHRLVHEGGFHVSHVNGLLTFSGPDGQLLSRRQHTEAAETQNRASGYSVNAVPETFNVKRDAIANECSHTTAVTLPTPPCSQPLQP